MYGLVQAGIIAHDALKDLHKPYVYAPAKITQVLWTHTDRDKSFTIVVDNFGIKYRHQKDADQSSTNLTYSANNATDTYMSESKRECMVWCKLGS